MNLDQIIREYLHDIPGASQRGIEDAHDKIMRAVSDCYTKAEVDALCEIAAAAGRKADEIALARRARNAKRWNELTKAEPMREHRKPQDPQFSAFAAEMKDKDYGTVERDQAFHFFVSGWVAAEKGDLTLREALESINTMACYASEEDTESREKVLLSIGKRARAAIAKARS